MGDNKKTEQITWVTVSEAGTKLNLRSPVIRRWIKQRDVRAKNGGPGGGYLVVLEDVIKRHSVYDPQKNGITQIEQIEEVLNDDKRKFVRTLRETYSVAHACRSIGIGRTTANTWKNQDAAFAAEWENALDSAMDRLENSLLERGMEKDTTAAIFLLKGRRPEKYRDNSRVEMTGKDGGAVEIKSDARKSITGKLATLAERAGKSRMDTEFN